MAERARVERAQAVSYRPGPFRRVADCLRSRLPLGAVLLLSLLAMPTQTVKVSAWGQGIEVGVPGQRAEDGHRFSPPLLLAGVSRVTQASAAATSVAFATPNANDLIVCCGYNDAAATAPALPAGYANLSNATSNTNGMRVSFLVAAGSETSTPVTTNTTDVAVLIFRGAGTPKAVIANGGTGATMTYSALALNFPDGNSWIAAFGGNRTAAAASAPTGLTLETNVTRLVASDSEATTRTWAVQTVAGNTNTGWRTCVVEIRATPPAYAIPSIVQRTTGSNTRSLSTGTSAYAKQFGEPTQAGNAIGVGWQVDNTGSPTIACTDDAGNVYVNILTHVDSNSQLSGVSIAVNTSSAKVVTVTGGASATGFKSAMLVEMQNVYSFDVSAANDATGTAVSAGSITPTISGDFIFQYVCQLNGYQTYTRGSNANITYKLGTIDSPDGQVTQGGVYNSTSAITVSLTQSSSAHFSTIAVAFFGGAVGAAAPAGMRVQTVAAYSLWAAANAGPGYTSTLVLSFPCSGNYIAFQIASGSSGGVGAAGTLSTPTDTNSNTWHKANSGATSNPHHCDFFYVEGATTSDDLRVTLTLSDTTSDHTIKFYDVVGAPTTSTFDTDSTASGNQTGTSPSLSGASITPTTTGGLTFSQIQMVNNTVTSVTGPTNVRFDSDIDAIETLDGPENLDQNGGWGHAVTAASTAQTYTWHYKSASDPQSNWLCYTVAVKGPAAGVDALEWKQPPVIPTDYARRDIVSS